MDAFVCTKCTITWDVLVRYRFAPPASAFRSGSRCGAFTSFRWLLELVGKLGELPTVNRFSANFLQPKEIFKLHQAFLSYRVAAVRILLYRAENVNTEQHRRNFKVDPASAKRRDSMQKACWFPSLRLVKCDDTLHAARPKIVHVKHSSGNAHPH